MTDSKRKKKRIRLGLTRLPYLLVTLVALYLWDQGTVAIGPLRFLCGITALLALRHIFLVARFPGFFTWFTAPYIGLFLVYPIIAPMTGVDIPATDEVFLDYLFLAVSGLNLFILGYELTTSRRHSRRWNDSYTTTSGRLANTINILLALNLFAVVILIMNAGSFGAILSQTRLDLKVNAGLLSMAGIYLLGLGALLYPLLAVQIRRRPSRGIFWIPIIVAVEVFLFLALRVRTFPVIHVVGLLVGWYLICPRLTVLRSRRSPRLRSRLTTIQKFALVGVACALVLGMFVHRTFRGQFQAAESLGDVEINVADSIRYAFEGGGELGYSKWVLQILEIVPSQHDYLYGLSYYRLLFVPIPRSIWPEKPYNSQRIVAQWLEEDAVSVQTSPVGVIGDLYVNFGMWGILGMALFGMVFGRVDRSSSLTQALLLAVSFAMIFHLARGGFTNPLINLAVYFFAAHATAKYLVGRANVSPTINSQSNRSIDVAGTTPEVPHATS